MNSGKRLEYDDPKFVALVKDVNKTIQVGSSFGPLAFIPWMAKLLPSSFLGTSAITDTIDSFSDYAKVHTHYIRFDWTHYLNFVYLFSNIRW